MRSRTPSRNGMLGSIDANRGDPQNGWDTDQFPNSVEDLALPLYEILQGGGFTTGGFNFDAKLRRQSTEPRTCSTPTSAGIDTLARRCLWRPTLLERESLSRCHRGALRGAGTMPWAGDPRRPGSRSRISGGRVASGEIDPNRLLRAARRSGERGQPGDLDRGPARSRRIWRPRTTCRPQYGRRPWASTYRPQPLRLSWSTNGHGPGCGSRRIRLRSSATGLDRAGTTPVVERDATGHTSGARRGRISGQRLSPLG